MSVALKFPRFDPKSFSRVAVIGVAALFLQAEAASAASITVTATIRDFSSSHADFEQGFAASETGIVLSALGPDGKPVYNEVCERHHGRRVDDDERHRELQPVVQ
jgi:cytochrome c5